MQKFLVFVLTLLPCICSEDLLLCTKDFCETYLEKETCSELPEACKVQNATHNGVFLPSPMPCHCCEFCVENLDEGDNCVIEDEISVTPATICGPGLTCTATSGGRPACQKKYDTNCLTVQRKYDQDRESGKLGYMQVRPKCDRNGLYEPFMCVPGEICYCVSEDGDRIFGEIPFTSNPEHFSDCACSRSNHKATDIRTRNLHHAEYFRCQSNGNYDTLQCIDDKCLCVDARDGHPTDPEMSLVNMTMISAETVPCFNNKTHLEAEYYQECEAVYIEQLKVIKKYEETGLEVFGYNLPNCQLDGYYAPVQQNPTAKFCVDPSGKLLEDFEVLKSDVLASSINCKCARARSIMMANQKPECEKNGNYKKIQCRMGTCRCVDENGLQVGQEAEQHEKDKLPCIDKE